MIEHGRPDMINQPGTTGFVIAGEVLRDGNARWRLASARSGFEIRTPMTSTFRRSGAVQQTSGQPAVGLRS
jgi:hypothetical protein